MRGSRDGEVVILLMSVYLHIDETLQDEQYRDSAACCLTVFPGIC